MKVLTMCSAGVVRSVAMAHRLKHDYGIDAVPLGHDTNSPETIEKLSEWADRIIVMQPRYADGIPKQFRHKLVPTHMTDVGPDVWLNPLAPGLQTIIMKMAFELYNAEIIKKG
jgi:predicted protein tyrosine phosphatase